MKEEEKYSQVRNEPGLKRAPSTHPSMEEYT